MKDTILTLVITIIFGLFIGTIGGFSGTLFQLWLSPPVETAATPYNPDPYNMAKTCDELGGRMAWVLSSTGCSDIKTGESGRCYQESCSLVGVKH